MRDEKYEDEAPMAETRTRPQRDRRDESASAELDRLGAYLHRVDEEVERLRERINPVLTPPRPSPALAGTVRDTDGTSALADRLHAMAEQASAAVSFLADMVDRVDL